jgi:glycosyltransferase involved in cell wall biosynthesis
MTALIGELCRGEHAVDAVPLVVGPLGALEDDAAVRERVPTDRRVQRALQRTLHTSRLVGHRAAFLSTGSAAAALAGRRLRLDVLHDLTGLAPFAAGAGACRRVITIHDLISYLPDNTNDRADDLVQRHWLPRAARAADAIVTVSATTGDDVARFLDVPRDRIHRADHGVDPHFGEMPTGACDRVLDRYGLSRGYVLFVGSAAPRKNLATLVAACRRLWADGLAVRLVVAGPVRPQAIPGVEPDVTAQRIHWLGYVAEADLPALYNGAAVLAYPSSYEGFGLPALEAMRCGTPVLAGDGGALPEVVGDAGVLVDPRDDDAMAQALRRLLTDEARRASLRTRGLRRAQGYTWARAAARTAAVYRALT